MKAWKCFLFGIVATSVSLLDVHRSHSFAPTWAFAESPTTLNPEAQKTIDTLSPQADHLDTADLERLAAAYSEQHNSTMAIKTYNLALVKTPKSAVLKTLLGKEQLKANKDREALLTLREALEVNIRYEPAYLAMVDIYKKKNNRYELRMLYTDMIKNVGEKPDYVNHLCELSTISGFYDDAKTYCRRGIVLKKDDPENYAFLAMTLKETGEMEEAKSLMRRASGNFPQSETVQLLYAQFLDEQKDFIGSNAHYRAAYAANPNSMKALLGIAASDIEIQKYADALATYTQACKLSKTALPPLRHSINILRIAKAEEWLTKFDDLSEICALPPEEVKARKAIKSP